MTSVIWSLQGSRAPKYPKDGEMLSSVTWWWRVYWKTSELTFLVELPHALQPMTRKMSMATGLLESVCFSTKIVCSCPFFAAGGALVDIPALGKSSRARLSYTCTGMS